MSGAQNGRDLKPGEVAMTCERTAKNGMLITVERGNADSVQTMELTSAEWHSLSIMIETFAMRDAPSVHLMLGPPDRGPESRLSPA